MKTGKMKLFNGLKLITTRTYCNVEERNIILSHWRLLSKEFVDEVSIQFSPSCDAMAERKVKLPKKK